QHGFARRLDGGDRAALAPRLLHDLLGAAQRPATGVKVVTDQVQERLAADERPGQAQRVAVAAWLGLFDERQVAGVLAGGGRVGTRVAGGDDQGDLVDAGGEDFLDDDFEGRLLRAVAIDQRLQRQRALSAAGGRDDGLANV